MQRTLLNQRYRLIRELGSGGFGQTFLAEAVGRGDRDICVVKQFKPANRDPSFLEIARRLFSSEVATLRRLGSHDQIPTLLDDFEENQEFYLVQEYVEGQSLTQELSEVTQLSESQVWQLLRDVLQVLQFVHQNQVIHRDIKPGNLIRRKRDGKFVLIDFGAVKQLQTQMNTELMQTGATVGIGTHGYGPSEQLMGKPRYSSDIYALGMTAIHALTGLQPSQLPTHPDTGEVVWRDQVEVSPKLAAILDRMVRYHFNQRFHSAAEVLRSLDQPTELIVDQTIAPLPPFSPVTFSQTEAFPASGVTTVRKRRPRWLASVILGTTSLAVTGLLLGMRQLGWLQPLELAAYDRMVQFSPDPGVDPRLLVVSITDADIQSYGFPVSDRVVAQLVKTLQGYKPRVIGLDLLRDLPQGAGRDELLKELKAPNLVAITNLGTPKTPAPPGVPADRVGFNDLVLDPGDVVRRNLLFASVEGVDYHAFSVRLAQQYLAREKIEFASNAEDSEVLHLGKAVFQPLKRTSGGYQSIDDQGYQILLKYRRRLPAQEVSLRDVLSGRLQPELIKDKVVLIGTTAATAKDLFSTPYSSATDAARMPGVLLHAQNVSQLLDAALEGRSLFWFWAEWVEGLWIVGWAVLGGGLALWVRHPIALSLGGTVLLATLLATGFFVFTRDGWIPLAAPALGAIGSGSLVVACRAYLAEKE